MFVLDVGCGTGAITAGIATAVGPDGRAVGLDRDEGLPDLARNAHAGIANVLFETGDATNLRYSAEFDIVTGARILQWIASPEKAEQSMKRATKPGGAVLVLDYSHLHKAWEPEPAREFRRFYEAFLAWRQANDWDNEMAHDLPDLFAGAGMTENSWPRRYRRPGRGRSCGARRRRFRRTDSVMVRSDRKCRLHD